MSITCLIPAYNESARLPYVLTQLSHVHNLDQIIVIDDGSTDNTSLLTTHFPKVTFLHHPNNRGKSAAIKTGLTQVKTANILLFDSDIDFIDPHEVEHSIKFFKTNKSVDMLVYRTVRDKWPQKLVRADLVLCGERLLRTSDLNHIMQQPISGYQLEIAINHYMLASQKKLVWIPFSGLSPNKIHKSGLAGIIPELKMVIDLFRFRGIFSYFADLINFHATQI